MFGINYNSHELKYIALSGLYLCIAYSAGLCPTLTYHIPSGLHDQVPKVKNNLGLDVNPTRLDGIKKSPERAKYNNI